LICGVVGDGVIDDADMIAATSDNFSFQNNGIKKCTCWKTMGFLRKQWGFFWGGELCVILKKSNVF